VVRDKFWLIPFPCLVHILACLQEPKFEHFQAVIDAYIQDHFAAALVYKGEGIAWDCFHFSFLWQFSKTFNHCLFIWQPVFRIRIRPDPKLFGLKDPDPKFLISDPDPDPSLFHNKLTNMF